MTFMVRSLDDGKKSATMNRSRVALDDTGFQYSRMVRGRRMTV